VTRVSPLRAVSASAGAADAGARVRVTRVLEEDPDLGEGLDAEALASAIERARAAVMHLSIGEWREPAWPMSTTSGFGLLVLDGLLLRRVRLGDRAGVELLAGGDLLRPWQREDSVCSVPRELGWQVLEPCRLAVLDVDFARGVSAFPQIAGQLTGRALRRSRNFAVNMAIVQQPRVETRLHMLLWHLADRSGTVGPDGVSVPLRLTQTVLAALVAAQRPTVSAALRALEQDGKLTHTNSGWLLHGSPPGELHFASQPPLRLTSGRRSSSARNRPQPRSA
jgi:CRP-like cAMP-binding protein